MIAPTPLLSFTGRVNITYNFFSCMEVDILWKLKSVAGGVMVK